MMVPSGRGVGVLLAVGLGPDVQLALGLTGIDVMLGMGVFEGVLLAVGVLLGV